MPFRIHNVIRAAALCAEMIIHATIFGLITAALLAQKAGQYELLQFFIDATVMFMIIAFLFFKDRYGDLRPGRIPAITCFSAVFLLSLIGATGLAVRAASGRGFCEEFHSSHPDNCREAGLAMALSWTSVIIAIVGILISWLDKHPEFTEAKKFSVQHQPPREIELLRQRAGSKTTNIYPKIHIPRPIAPHTTSRSQGPYRAEGPVPPAPAQALPRPPPRIRVPSSPLPPSLSSDLNGNPFMLHRQLQRAVGQAPRNQSAFMRIDDSEIFSAGSRSQKVNEKDMWKQKYLAQRGMSHLTDF